MENLNSVGVVTISYNQVRYLPTCIRSVCDQMRQGDEYVVVDPGSSDGSREIIESAAGGSSFMNTIFQKDSGPADGLNRGFSFLNTDVAAYLNSDDFYLPGGISYARRFMDLNPEIDMFI
jgi:glycosyltransferase involved in cell wall biosynthesis